MKIEPYLFFEGRCEEALTFYRDKLGAKILALMRYKESPDPAMLQGGNEDKVMHATFQLGDSMVMASDGCCKGQAKFVGFSLCIAVKEETEAERIFATLSDGGQIQMPMEKTFWAQRFGMVADRFGISWMVMAIAE